MPPRWASIGIVLFWLVATGWLIQRDLWPSWFPPPDNPPPYEIDMVDEFGSSASWHVFVGGEEVGAGRSEIILKKDGSLVFSTRVGFEKKPLLGLCSSISSENHITNQGQLLEFSISAKLKLESPLELILQGRVDKGFVKPRLTIVGFFAWELDPIEVSENGIVFNPAALGTRIRNISKGQTWRVPSLDLGALTKNPFVGSPYKGVLAGELYAFVDEEVIRWGKDDVLCYRIDMRKGGREPEASIWVRKRDGQVLKQSARLHSLDLLPAELLLVRVPNPN